MGELRSDIGELEHTLELLPRGPGRARLGPGDPPSGAAAIRDQLASKRAEHQALTARAAQLVADIVEHPSDEPPGEIAVDADAVADDGDLDWFAGPVEASLDKRPVETASAVESQDVRVASAAPRGPGVGSFLWLTLIILGLGAAFSSGVLVGRGQREGSVPELAAPSAAAINGAASIAPMLETLAPTTPPSNAPPMTLAERPITVEPELVADSPPVELPVRIEPVPDANSPPVVIEPDLQAEGAPADVPAAAPPRRIGALFAPGFAGVNLRATPSLSAPTMLVVPAGAEIEILEGTAPADGLAWQQIGTARGLVGWVVAGTVVE
jgi:hypothetical protein